MINPEHFGTRFTLLLTHRCINFKEKCPNLVVCLEILNPKYKELVYTQMNALKLTDMCKYLGMRISLK